MTTWIEGDNGNRASVEYWGSEESAIDEANDLRRQLAAAQHELAEARRALEGLKPAHKCECIARIHNMQPGRDWWLGKLTEPVPEWPHETHCLHIKTPLKDIVLLCNMGDLQGLTVLCDIPFPIVNATWKERMRAAYQRAAMVDIIIDDKSMRVPSATLAFLLKAQAGIDPHRVVWKQMPAGVPEKCLADTDHIEVRSGDEFWTSPAGTF